jgi:hypothetical protein
MISPSPGDVVCSIYANVTPVVIVAISVPARMTVPPLDASLPKMEAPIRRDSVSGALIWAMEQTVSQSWIDQSAQHGKCR